MVSIRFYSLKATSLKQLVVWKWWAGCIEKVKEFYSEYQYTHYLGFYHYHFTMLILPCISSSFHLSIHLLTHIIFVFQSKLQTSLNLPLNSSTWYSKFLLNDATGILYFLISVFLTVVIIWENIEKNLGGWGVRRFICEASPGSQSVEVEGNTEIGQERSWQRTAWGRLLCGHSVGNWAHVCWGTSWTGLQEGGLGHSPTLLLPTGGGSLLHLQFALRPESKLKRRGCGSCWRR